MLWYQLLLLLLLQLLLRLRLQGGPEAPLVDRQIPDELDPRPRHGDVARRGRPVCLRLLELQPRLREIGLRGDAFAAAKLVDRVRALR